MERRRYPSQDRPRRPHNGTSGPSRAIVPLHTETRDIQLRNVSSRNGTSGRLVRFVPVDTPKLAMSKGTPQVAMTHEAELVRFVPGQKLAQVQSKARLTRRDQAETRPICRHTETRRWPRRYTSHTDDAIQTDKVVFKVIFIHDPYTHGDYCTTQDAKISP